VRAYRLLQRLLPRPFRDRFGRDMADVFADRRRHARRKGRVALTTLWIHTAIDLGSTAWREHRRDALRSFAWRPRMLKGDVAYAWRMIARQRRFSLAVSLTIALGIGATTAVFTVANALLFRTLPYANADRLVRIYEEEDQEGFSGSVALGNLDDWCTVPGIEACGAFTTSDLNLAGGETPERVRAAVATPGLYAALDISPVTGRLITGDDVAVAAPVIVVSNTAGRRLFGSQEPVGRTLLLDGVRFDVVGVIPDVPALADVAVWRGVSTLNQSRRNHANRGVARLRAGVPMAAVREQLKSVSIALQEKFPDTNAHWWGRIEPLQTALGESFSVPLRALGALTAVLLVLCAVSAASLMAGRSAGRQRELAVRMALGASRTRLVTQLFIESLVLAVGGALMGALLAHWTIGAVLSVFPPRTALWREPSVDLPVLAFAMAAALMSAVFFGLIPALGLTRRATAASSLQLRSTHSAGRLRAALTALQTGLAALLLVAASMLGAVLTSALLKDPGFRTENLQLFNVTAPKSGYADAGALASFFARLTERLQHLPQIESVGAVFNPPMSGSSTTRGVIRANEPIPARGAARLVLFQVSTPGYLKTMGLKLVDGRDFSETDTAASAPVTIINQRLAEMLWPGERAVGRQLIVHTDEKAPRTVIGVIADAMQGRLAEPIRPEHYVPLAQSPRRTLTFAVRLTAPLSRAALQAEISAVDPTLPVYEFTSMESMIERGGSSRVSITRLSGFFASAALLLAVVGLYGLVSAGVTERTREIGVRLALGATSGTVLALAFRRGMLMAILGTGAGLAGTAPLKALMSDVIGDAPPSTAGVAAFTGILLIIVAAIACWIPARAALRVDPATSLRPE
jgi:predicted permease